MRPRRLIRRTSIPVWDTDKPHLLGLEEDDEEVEQLSKVEEHKETTKREVGEPVRRLVDVCSVDGPRELYMGK